MYFINSYYFSNFFLFVKLFIKFIFKNIKGYYRQKMTQNRYQSKKTQLSGLKNNFPNILLPEYNILFYVCRNNLTHTANSIEKLTQIPHFFFVVNVTNSYRLCKPSRKILIHVNDERRLNPNTACQAIRLCILRSWYMNDL